jgi:CHAT domain-containing protein/tetratricopeptide (TPR) repeat protein
MKYKSNPYFSFLSMLAILVLHYLDLSAQNQNKIDSLQNVINTIENKCKKPCESDTARIHAYIVWGEMIYLQKPDVAFKLFEKAENISSDLVNQKKLSNDIAILANTYLAKSIHYQGFINFYKGNTDLALLLFEKSLKIKNQIVSDYNQKKNLNLQRDIAETINNIGFIYQFKGDLLTALDYFILSNDIYERLIKSNDNNLRQKGQKGLAIGFNNLGTLSKNMGEIQQALFYYEESLNIRKEINDPKGFAYTYSNIGSIYHDRGQIKKAKENYHKALKLLLETNDRSGIANIYNNLAVIYDDQGEIFKALEYHNKALDIFQELGNVGGMARSYNNLASIYLDQNNLEKAEQYYKKSLDFCLKTGDQTTLSYIYNNLGTLYDLQLDRGELKGLPKNELIALDKLAADHYKKSQDILFALGDKKGYANALSNLSVYYQKANNDSCAMSNARDALEVYQEIGHEKGITSSMIKLGQFYLWKNDIKNAEQYALPAYEKSKTLNFPDEQAKASQLMKDLNVLKKQYSQADSYAVEVIKYHNKAIFSNFSVLSEKEQEKYFNQIKMHYDDFSSYSLIRKNKNPEIVSYVFDNTIRNKGLLLKSSTALRNAILDSGDSLLIANYFSWIELKKEIAAKYSRGKNSSELEKAADLKEKELVKSSSVFSDFNKLQTLSWKDVQQNLKPHEAAVEFIHFKLSDGKNIFSDTVLYCALVLTSNSTNPEMIPLFNEADLAQQIIKKENNDYSYVNRVYGSAQNTNNEIYNLVWKKLEPALNDINKIYIAPTGLLHKISFSTLPVSQNIFLCDKYEIDMKNSCSSIAFSSNTKNELGKNATIFGGINYNSSCTKNKFWSFLNGTKSETETISNLLNSNSFSVSYYSDSSASEGLLKELAGNSDLLHISTHGFFFPDPTIDIAQEVIKEEKTTFIDFRAASGSPATVTFVKNNNPLMRSGLVLAGANDSWNSTAGDKKEDGVFTAQEVSTIDMRNTELVVLSACETGLGDIKGSEGVYGLQRAFKMAGAQYLIMSLWQVPDKETEEFMVTFYTKLIAIKDIRKAFNLTQKEMRQKYDPYFWGAFVLVE